MAAKQEEPARDFYEEARWLLISAQAGTLATAADGVPFAALVTPAILPDLRPIFLFSTLSSHTRQLQANPACALLVVGQASGENPQTAPRVCLTGTAAPAADEAARDEYLSVHPYAEFYSTFADFAFWRMEVTGAHYIGGFAAAARLEVARLRP